LFLKYINNTNAMKYKILHYIVLAITFFVTTNCKTKRENPGEIVPPATENIVTTQHEPETSIHEAALNGQLAKVVEILSEGKNVNTIDKEERTALMYASFNGHTEIMRKLIEKGAQINFRDLYGRTALMMASSGPFPDAVKLLLDNNADPNIPDKEEHFTALMYAAAEGQLENVKLLISFKADPSLKDIDGDNAITFASNNGHKEVVELLRSVIK
jgi:ankyrin repeat protein